MMKKALHNISVMLWRIEAIFLIVCDFVFSGFAYFFALWIRFDCVYSKITPFYLKAWHDFIIPYSLAVVLVFFLLRGYKTVWQYAGFFEYAKLITGSIAMSAAHAVAITVIFGRMPLSYYILGMIFQLVLVIIPRVMASFIHIYRVLKHKADGERKNVMLIGAGSAGQLILKDIKLSSHINEKVVCFIDDDPKMRGMYIENIPVAGNRDTILENVKKYNVHKIYLTIPTAPVADRRDILNICKETDCELKQLPAIYQIVNGQVNVASMKSVSVEDLLGRDPIKADMDEVFRFINGKVVLVTGGGGSIGSELCRQIANCKPKRLIIFDIFENNAYSIQLELKNKHPELDLVTLIGSVRDSKRLDRVFSDYKPQIVYHAAAHKHVPLMEDSPCEAIKNNAIGTYKTAFAAMSHGTERFVLVSTDKAVNPTNIMGASKRLCEMIIQSFDKKIKEGEADKIPPIFTHSKKLDQDKENIDLKNAKTEFVAVRFGNVLGSSGSVVPLFKKQIAEGGPVTVTHPDIIRYFMTIPEAVSLVMTAGTYAKGGEIFVLDMGNPVKIDTLARNLIRLSGFTPDVDIKIEYTGLRPGEKLYEEKLMAEEGLKKTDNRLIHIGCPIPFDTDEFLIKMEYLTKAAYNNTAEIKEIVEKIVLTYHPAEN